MRVVMQWVNEMHHDDDEHVMCAMLKCERMKSDERMTHEQM